MSGFEQVYLVGVIGAFALFAVVLAWADMATKHVRDSKKH